MDEQATTEEEPGYGIGAVARRLGVPAPTLRTWNLRYGVGPSRRSPGGHRRYDTGDLRRLEEMNRLIREGVPAADAARQVLRTVAAPPGDQIVFPPQERAQDGPAPAPPAGSVQTTPAPPAARPVQETFSAAPSWTRPVIPTAAMLARAAIMLDSRTVSEWIVAALDRHGVIWTWENLVLPVFGTICRRQAETGASVEIEHLFSDRVLAALTRLVERPARPVNERPVLLACAADEQHSLPIYALAAALTTDRHVETRVLGARTPYPALADAMRRLGPAAVFVWSQLPTTGDLTPLASLPLLRPASRVIAGGPGWWGELPPSVSRVMSFRDALAQIGVALR
ncbi:MerR family transcriptional regulator [Streptosporangium sp. CA-135522]|uniref:MerR family transcriptional regulator n=1 Tax=Streptosporangium sp. CA-135522 TaxID=3240072 RepID=UPI003D8BD45D